MRLGRRALMLGGGAALSTRPALADCPAALAKVPLNTASGPCVVPVSLGGHTVRMVLDTGAERTVLTRSAVARFGLPLDEFVGSTMRGAGGRLDEHRNAIVANLSIGGVGLAVQTPGGALSLPVVAFELDDIAGLLGGDMLRHTTLDFDFAAGWLSVLPDRTCAQSTAVAVPLTLLRRFLLLAPIELDGHKLTALVDTGASISLINARGLHRLGLSTDRTTHDPEVFPKVLGGNIPAHRHSFGTLRIGGYEISAPRLLVYPQPEPAFDLVLGLDILARQKIRLSYAEPRLELG